MHASRLALRTPRHPLRPAVLRSVPLNFPNFPGALKPIYVICPPPCMCPRGPLLSSYLPPIFLLPHPQIPPTAHSKIRSTHFAHPVAIFPRPLHHHHHHHHPPPTTHHHGAPLIPAYSRSHRASQPALALYAHQHHHTVALRLIVSTHIRPPARRIYRSRSHANSIQRPPHLPSPLPHARGAAFTYA